MDIEKEILRRYKSKYDFAKKNNITPQNVNYWCKKGFLNLRMDIQFKIKEILSTGGSRKAFIE